jgi:UDP-N-acetylmuramoyl-L-alanyl-D-glutamate--2,6-diaminopimelate ligase
MIIRAACLIEKFFILHKIKPMIPQEVIDYIRSTKDVVRHCKNVRKGSVFVLASFDLSDEDSVRFIEEAVKMCAQYVIAHEKFVEMVAFERLIGVSDPSAAWAFIANILYEKIPSRICAVTGTSGKTSVAYLYSQAAAILSGKALYIGTLGALEINHDLSTNRVADTLTTPDVMDLRQILSENSCEYTCIEASSHGIEQQRIAYIPIVAAAFTNLSPEHLDYHKDMESYFKAKEKLFKRYNIDNFVINTDDEFGRRIPIIGKSVITYGKDEKANLKLIELVPGKMMKILCNGNYFEFEYNLLGNYNAYNFLCAMGLLMYSGFIPKDILEIAHKLSLPPGRMQKIEKNNVEVYVDYAHKPDALQNVLRAMIEYREINSKGKIWVVFGCGGDRDKMKRPMMGRIASEMADFVVVTDDNPRHEDPSAIRQEIIAGMGYCEHFEIPDRAEAIAYAIRNAKKNDIILVAGKGHENYQIVGDMVFELCDVKIVKEQLILKQEYF